MKTEQNEKKRKEFFYSLCVNVFFGLSLYVELYLSFAMPIISHAFLNQVIYGTFFVPLLILGHKLDPYKGYRKLQGWITRLIGAGVYALMIFCFGYSFI
ncbi:MAG TPA: hypothetical protein VFK33_07620 [Bacillales bacterium]|nr:hypothetical protein [Bacillales bacterium]